jgi:ribosomal protein S19E (S16A)
MANVEIGKTLGIYPGHVGHEGHIPRTILAMLEEAGVVEQDEDSKRWSIVDHGA